MIIIDLKKLFWFNIITNNISHKISKLNIIILYLFLFLFNLQLFINPNKKFSSNSGLNSTINFNQVNSTYSHKFTQTLTAFNHFNVLNHWFKHKAQITSHLLYRYIDKGILELFGPQGLSRKFNYIGFNIELLSTASLAKSAI